MFALKQISYCRSKSRHFSYSSSCISSYLAGTATGHELEPQVFWMSAVHWVLVENRKANVISLVMVQLQGALRAGMDVGWGEIFGSGFSRLLWISATSPWFGSDPVWSPMTFQSQPSACTDSNQIWCSVSIYSFWFVFDVFVARRRFSKFANGWSSSRSFLPFWIFFLLLT